MATMVIPYCTAAQGIPPAQIVRGEGEACVALTFAPGWWPVEHHIEIGALRRPWTPGDRPELEEPGRPCVIARAAVEAMGASEPDPAGVRPRYYAAVAAAGPNEHAWYEGDAGGLVWCAFCRGVHSEERVARPCRGPRSFVAVAAPAKGEELVVLASWGPTLASFGGESCS